MESTLGLSRLNSARRIFVFFGEVQFERVRAVVSRVRADASGRFGTINLEIRPSSSTTSTLFSFLSKPQPPPTYASLHV